MRIAIEQLQLVELLSFLREQAEDTFPDLRDSERLRTLAEKWHSFAEFCTCRDKNGVLKGMVVFYANRPDVGVAYIPHVYVRGESRGQGIMSSMFKFIEGYVKEKGFTSLCLEVQKSNEIAQRAYIHYGFLYCGEASEKSIYLQFRIL